MIGLDALLMLGLLVLYVSSLVSLLVRGAASRWLLYAGVALSAGASLVSWALPGLYPTSFFVAPLLLGYTLGLLWRAGRLWEYALLAAAAATPIIGSTLASFDPRGGLLLPAVVQASLVLAGFAASRPSERLSAIVSSVLVIPLAVFYMLWTEAATPLFMDPVELGLLLLLASGIAGSRLLTRVSGLVLAAGVARILFGGFYVAAVDPSYAAAGILLVVACGFAVLAWGERIRVERARLPSLTLLAASAAASYAKLPWAASLLYVLYASSLAGFTPLAASLAASLASLASPWAGVMLAAAAAVAASVARRGRDRSAAGALLLSGVVLLALTALLASGCNAVDAAVEPVGLGKLVNVTPPNEDIVHQFYFLYMGVKNETLAARMLYAQLIRQGVPRDEAYKQALMLYQFLHAVRTAAEKKGVHDPYPLTALEHPRSLPVLEARICTLGACFRAPIHPQAILEAVNYTVSIMLVDGVNLIRYCGVSSEVARQLQFAYLRLLANTSYTDGDALRYTLYASMIVSYSRLRNMSLVARLLLNITFGNETVPPEARGLVYASVMPGGLLLLGAGLAALPVSALSYGLKARDSN